MSRTMLESSEGACFIECSDWDVKVSRLDVKNDQVECAFTGQSMIRIHFQLCRFTQNWKWDKKHTKLCVTVEGALILLEAKSMMTIDFDKDVGQRVLVTDYMSVKSVMGRHVLISGFVEFGEIRTEKWKERYNTAESEAKAVSAGVLWNHLDMLTWSDVIDVISWCYVQWCDVLSWASSVSSSYKIERGSEMNFEVTQPWRSRANIYVSLQMGNVTRGDEDNIIGEESGDFVLDRTCVVARTVWTSVEHSQDNRRIQW